MKHSFKTLLTLALALVAGNAWGETVTSTFTDKNWKVGEGEAVWTANGAAANSLETSSPSRGVQVTLANIKSDGLTLTNTSIKDLGAISKVEIVYSSNCGGTSDGTIAVAVGSTAFGSAFTIKKENNATISFENETAVEGDIVITFTSTATSKSVYVKSITVTYSETTPTDDVLESLVVSGTPTKTEYKVGDAFDPAGLKVTGTYSESGEKDVTSGITWTADPETFTSASTNATVSVTATVGTVTSPAFSVTGLTITEPAPSVAWDAREQDYVASTTAVSDITFGDGTIVTGVFDKGTNSNIPKYFLGTSGNNTTGAVRVYGGGTLTLQAQAGYKICGVEFGFGQGDGTNTISADKGTFAVDTWTGSSSEVVFTVGGSSGNRRFQTITVSYEASSAVATPAFSVKEGVFFDAFDLTLTCATDGAAIHYTTDGTTPTSASAVYSSAISISATTTVKAIATKSGMDDSEVASATYTLGKSYASLAELVADGEPTTTGETVKVTFENVPITKFYTSSGNRNGIYLMAGDKEIEIFCYDVPEEWVVGGTVSATLTCTWKKYNTTWELCPTSWDDITYTSSKTLTSVVISGTPTKTSYQEDDEFDPAGLVVTGTYNDASTDGTMASRAIWSCTPATLTAGTTSVTVTATVSGITSEAYVVNVTVKAVVPTGNFALYTGTLVEGDYVIYYNGVGEVGGKAMKASVSLNRLQYQEVTPTDNVITEPDASIVWHIAASGDYYTIYNAAEEKYAASNGTKNQAALVASVTDNALWNLSYVGGYEFVNKVNAGKGVNANLRNNSTYGFACYSTSTGDALKLYKKTDAATPVREHGATITSAGFATLYLDFAAAIPTGVTAYTAVAAEDAVTLTEIEDVIPAETAVVLEGAAGTYTFEEATTTAPAPANNLVGTLTATTYTAVKGSHNYVYVLGQKDGVVGFYKLSEAGTIKANSAYLALDENPASGSIIIRKGDATAISLVQENEGEAVIYDLLGRRVSEPIRGIYIVNGKKMFIK